MACGLNEKGTQSWGFLKFLLRDHEGTLMDRERYDRVNWVGSFCLNLCILGLGGALVSDYCCGVAVFM